MTTNKRGEGAVTTRQRRGGNREDAATSERRRWLIIGMLAVSFAVLTLEWYSVVPAFTGISDDFGIGLPLLSLLVSLFFFGYAAAHIPVGFAAASFGAKKVLVLGLLVISVAAGISGLVGNYAFLALLRVVEGVGAAAIVGAGLQLASSWSRPSERKFVLGGIVNGVGFTSGAAIALYVWVGVIQHLGWRGGLVLAGAVGLLLTGVCGVFVKTPAALVELKGGRLSLHGVRGTLGSRDLWGVGLGALGAYAAFFTVSQVGPSYAQTNLGFSAAAAGLLAAVVLLSGIPGGIIGGLLSDRSLRFLPPLAIPGALIVLLIALLPLAGKSPIWVIEIAVGFLMMFQFSTVAAAAAEYEDIAPEDFATGVGIILLLGNIGAVVDPLIYATLTEQISTSAGWWGVAGVATLSWFGFLLAREPHRPLRAHADSGGDAE